LKRIEGEKEGRKEKKKRVDQTKPKECEEGEKRKE